MADVSTVKKYLDLDGLARVKAKADARYVKRSGDTMTGPLTVQIIHGISGQLNFFTDVAYIRDSQLTPTTAKNGAMDLGKTDGRWRNVYSVLGNFTGAVTALTFASTSANGTAPFAVASSTVVSKLNADMLDGIHANGLLTGMSLTGVNGNTLAATVGGVTKTARFTPHADYGSRYFKKTDNGGRTTFLLIADITALDSTASGGGSYGFTGRVTSSRIGGVTNNCEHGVDVVCRASWSADLANDLKTSNADRIRPVTVTYQGRKYLALIFLGSGCDVVLTGWWRNCFETFTERLTPLGGTVPDGVEIVNSRFEVGAGYMAASAEKLRAARSLWGQTFNGTASVSGNMTGVGSVSASGEIATTSNNAFRAKYGDYGVILRNDGSSFYILETAKGDAGGNWSDLRPFQLSLATGNITLGSVLKVNHGGNVGVGNLAPAHKLDVAGTVRAATGFLCSRANSGSALQVAKSDSSAMLQTTNGYGNNYMAVTKTYGENGVFIQQQNGRYGYETVYIKKEDIEAGNNNPLSMLRLDEDGTVSVGSHIDLGTERVEQRLNLYRTLRLFRKTGVAVDVRCNDDNELEVYNAVRVKNKLTLRSASGKEVELTVSDTGTLLVNGSPVVVSIKV